MYPDELYANYDNFFTEMSKGYKSDFHVLSPLLYKILFHNFEVINDRALDRQYAKDGRRKFTTLPHKSEEQHLEPVS